MQDFDHCRQCGRELLNTIFCSQCEQCLCSYRCLDEHIAGRVLRPTAARLSSACQARAPIGRRLRALVDASAVTLRPDRPPALRAKLARAPSGRRLRALVDASVATLRPDRPPALRAKLDPGGSRPGPGDHSRAFAANSNGLSEKAPPAGNAPGGGAFIEP